MADISFATLGSCPVPGATPGGDDARYEPEYAAVLEEIEKLSFSGQGSAVSWPAIEKNAILILSEKSKDLQIAAYLGVALWQNRGLEGLRDGVCVLTGLLETFWETGWPALKRMRGRVNAIDWWHERTYGFLQDVAGQGVPIPPAQQEELLQRLAALDELVSSLMPDASPLRDLTAAVRRLPTVQEEQPPVEEQAAPEPSSPPPTPEPAPSPQAVVTEPAPSSQVAVAEPVPQTEDPAVLRRQFAAAGLAYLAAARRVKPADASLWQLTRLIVWGAIAALPADEGGQTLLPTPDMAALARVRQTLQAGNALEAALAAEEFFVIAPFCLDAQELVHTALTALGPQFAEAAKIVQEESVRFFSRLPGVETLSFTDGTPFAAPDTISWLRGAAVIPAKEPAPVATGTGPYDAAVAAARELAAQNKLPEALNALDAAKTVSAAINLRLRTFQLHLLQKGGKRQTAQVLAESLLGEVTARDLDTWDPQLALETLLVVRSALMLDGPRYEQELRNLQQRIARLSPAAALD